MHARVLRLTSHGNVEARTDNDLLVVFQTPPDQNVGLNDLLEFSELALDADVAVANRTRCTKFTAFIAAGDVHDLRLLPAHGSTRTPSQARIQEA